jgi:hypothetical protein
VSVNAAKYTCEECAGPAKIQLPEILWALMGISVTSAVASPLIKSSKAQRTKKDTDSYYKLKLTPAENGEVVLDDVRKPIMVDVFDEDGNPTGRQKHIKSNYTAEGVISKRVKGPPKISDMFMSEDAGSEYVLDIGKVQNFFFTMVAVLIYGFVLGAAIVGTKSIAALYQFPDLGEGLVAIISISHAGYLVSKATPTDPGPST